MKFSGFCLVLLIICGMPDQSLASSWCNPTKAPTVTIRASTDRISYNFDLSEKQLNEFSVTTVNPYGDNVITDVGGLMKGGIQTQQKMSFGTLTNRNTNEICMWHDSIDIMIHISPTIYIAREFPRGSCMHNAIMEHEQKHVMVDREIVNKYANLVGQAIKNDVAKYRVFGPVSLSQQNALHKVVKDRMQTVLTQYTNAMSAERKKRQQQVDSLPEYERVNKMCKR